MTTLVYEDLRTAVEATAPDKLATIMSAMAQAYGAGGLTDAEYEQLDGLLAARHRVGQAAPVRMQTLATACTQLVPAAALPLGGEGTAPTRRPHHRTGSRPRSAESASRRRRWAAAGYLPPKLAAGFTLGEQAVLAVIAMEIGKRGTCTLALGHIAALAGVCATVAKRALRQARTLGLVTVKTRRITGFRNDTNALRIASAEWASWLRLRMPRASHTGLKGGGGTVVPRTDIQILRRPPTSQAQAENRPIAPAQRPTQPAARGAAA